ncbi:MAG TPA: PfkB family carbohydrate kinase [Bacteroidaceae bacterium]|nr:PfkB family carbohydrate kinase [Bacteroidaceae bacterium]
MRKVFGVSETVYDIIFRNEQPIAAVPGGSVFNGLISLGRLGVKGVLISEVGDDRVGETIERFLVNNGVCTDYISKYKGTKTSISLAYLDENNDACYSFYKDYDKVRLDFEMPTVKPNDVVMFGSYYALNPIQRSKVLEFLKYAKGCGAILYYDLNFRDNHKNEIDKLIGIINENYELSDIVRGSKDDFRTLYGISDVDKIFQDRIAPYCQCFICTGGASDIELRYNSLSKSYVVDSIENISSTIGAGDNFNSGIVFGIIRGNITKDKIGELKESDWDRLIKYGIDFGSEVCKSINNYISLEFAEKYALSSSKKI